MTGQEIFIFRMTRRMNQETLGTLAGVSRSLVSQVENDYRVSEDSRQKVVDTIVRLKAQEPRPARKNRKAA